MDLAVEVRRSRRRTRTVSARYDGGRLIVSIPDRMTRAQERAWVEKMREDFLRKRAKARPTDEALHQRARALSRQYLRGRAVPLSVRWVTNQNSRWGSCTPAEGTIRLSHRL
ncbi:MAG: M48 family metallopeptidase, partial [Promicromonosporaceae bacterium]|nr:M48 family metallopeptidase [Promicromonosporaceae bacterium]